MDLLRTAHIELQEKFNSLQATASKARSDNQLLREESLMLRDKIVQLIRYATKILIDLVWFSLFSTAFFPFNSTEIEKRIACGNVVIDFYTCNEFKPPISG